MKVWWEFWILFLWIQPYWSQRSKSIRLKWNYFANYTEGDVSMYKFSHFQCRICWQILRTNSTVKKWETFTRNSNIKLTNKKISQKKSTLGMWKYANFSVDFLWDWESLPRWILSNIKKQRSSSEVLFLTIILFLLKITSHSTKKQQNNRKFCHKKSLFNIETWV